MSNAAIHAGRPGPEETISIETTLTYDDTLSARVAFAERNPEKYERQIIKAIAGLPGGYSLPRPAIHHTRIGGLGARPPTDPIIVNEAGRMVQRRVRRSFWTWLRSLWR